MNDYCRIHIDDHIKYSICIKYMGEQCTQESYNRCIIIATGQGNQYLAAHVLLPFLSLITIAINNRN